MKNIYVLFSILIVCVQLAMAQESQIKGTVVDADTKDPLEGATVKCDKAKGVLTDASGKFILKVAEGAHDLSISFIGYKTDKRQVSVTAGQTLTLEVPLNSSALQMNQVVTVSQYGKNSARETVSVDVIGKEEIQNTNSNDLDAIVSKVPGVLVQDNQIVVRGGSAFSYGVGTRTAVLLDGMPLVSGDLQQVQSTFAPTELVKQVEVVKGASSVVYGAGALDGVINIISGWPTESEPKTEIETNAGVVGPPHYAYMKWWDASPPFFGNINVVHQRRIGNFQLVLGGNLTNNNSYLTEDNQFRIRLSARVRYISPKIPGLTIDASAATQTERSDQFFISEDLDTNALRAAQSSSSDYQFTYFHPHINYTTIKGHSYRFDVNYQNIFRKGNGTDRNAVDHSFDFINQYQYRYHRDLVIVTAGTPANVSTSVSNLYPGAHNNYTVAGFLQAEINYKILSIQGGARYEVAGVDTQVIKTRPVFRAGVNVQAAKATWFRASWGQGYRVPSIAEKYIAQNFTSDIFIIPNDTLKEETSWSLELGFRQGLLIRRNWKLFFDASFFWQQYKNYIEYIVNVYPNKYPNGQPIANDSFDFPKGSNSGLLLGPKPFNYQNFRNAGYELTVNADGKIGAVGIKIQGGYTYVYPIQQNSDTSPYPKVGTYLRDLFKYNFQKIPPAEASNVLPLSVRHLVHTDIEVKYWKMYLGASFNYYSIPDVAPAIFIPVAALVFHNADAVSEYFAEHPHGDFVMDLRTGIKINEHFSMGFIIKNATNRFYELRPGLAEAPRNYTIQFKYTF